MTNLSLKKTILPLLIHVDSSTKNRVSYPTYKLFKENTYIAWKRLFGCHVDNIDPNSLLSSVAHAKVEPFEICGLRV